MRIALAAAAAAIGLAWAGAASAQELTPQQAEIIRDDPPASPQQLVLRDVPRPAVELFNGRNLMGWLPWLGYADTSRTFRARTVDPLGTGADWREIFAVESMDGGPVIRAGGRWWGSLATSAEFADFHLSLEYRWGDAAAGQARNNGVIYFSHGERGGVFGTWQTGIEFQLEHGSNGMAIPMGNAMRTRTTIARDRSVRYPFRVFRLGGKPIDLANGNPAYSVEAASQAEKPIGEWNRIDLYVVGSDAVHVVNGVPVMVLRDISEIVDRKRVPLSRGRIQLQAEGGTTYFRNIRIEPIRRLPRVVAAR